MRESHDMGQDRVRVIREATGDDAVALLAYIDDIAGESDNLTFGPGEFVMDVKSEKEFLERTLRTDNCLYLLALEGERIIGSLNFIAGSRPRIAHAGEFGISVRRDCWNQGVGSALLSAFLNWAHGAETGIRKINLVVRADNVSAIGLYKKFGFVEEGRTSRLFRFNDSFVDGVHMGLCID
ncbi:MAG: GNAT family N-acetyltransferase [Sphaerochaetaceae bacterium]|jgi:RimJ/RimL family protein N-acetyltransferase